jgi:hypothetical protein
MLTHHRSAMSSSLIAERTTKSIDDARSPARRRVVGAETPATPDRLDIIGLRA